MGRKVICALIYATNCQGLFPLRVLETGTLWGHPYRRFCFHELDNRIPPLSENMEDAIREHATRFVALQHQHDADVQAHRVKRDHFSADVKTALKDFTTSLRKLREELAAELGADFEVVWVTPTLNWIIEDDFPVSEYTFRFKVAYNPVYRGLGPGDHLTADYFFMTANPPFEPPFSETIRKEADRLQVMYNDLLAKFEANSLEFSPEIQQELAAFDELASQLADEIRQDIGPDYIVEFERTVLC